LYASDLKNPRLIRTAPNGDIFLAESSAGEIKIFRGMTSDGKPQQVSVYATKLNRPYGIAFYPVGSEPQWVYVGNTDSVVRFPYKNGDLKATGPAQHVVYRMGAGTGRVRWSSPLMARKCLWPLVPPPT
jgi:glucose/arabinose dehydrogenase